jgi:hypothetical protein
MSIHGTDKTWMLKKVLESYAIKDPCMDRAQLGGGSITVYSKFKKT